jgi:hypothetical protein
MLPLSYRNILTRPPRKINLQDHAGRRVPMTDSEMTGLDMALVLGRFSERPALVRRLAMESEAFRSLCEDFALAANTLAQLNGRQDRDRHAAVISDYVLLVADLEKDIAAALGDAEAEG